MNKNEATTRIVNAANKAPHLSKKAFKLPFVGDQNVIDDAMIEMAKPGHLATIWRPYGKRRDIVVGFFPIIVTDTFETLLVKWGKLFPEEAKDFVNQCKVQNSLLYKENGMSEGGVFRYGGAFPPVLHSILTEAQNAAMLKNVEGFDFSSGKYLNQARKIAPIMFSKGGFRE